MIKTVGELRRLLAPYPDELKIELRDERPVGQPPLKTTMFVLGGLPYQEESL